MIAPQLHILTKVAGGGEGKSVNRQLGETQICKCLKSWKFHLDPVPPTFLRLGTPLVALAFEFYFVDIVGLIYVIFQYQISHIFALVYFIMIYWIRHTIFTFSMRPKFSFYIS